MAHIENPWLCVTKMQVKPPAGLYTILDEFLGFFSKVPLKKPQGTLIEKGWFTQSILANLNYILLGSIL